VDYVHACSFCGWSRDAATPVVLPAGCPDCGCAVDSLSRAERDCQALAAASDELAPFEPSRALRAAVWLFALCFACAAARVGYVAGGVAGALTAIGLSGFLLLPFVPERVGDARARTDVAA
jgi:predicted  nucleic acid-binding Zn-ribbon protein